MDNPGGFFRRYAGGGRRHPRAGLSPGGVSPGWGRLLVAPVGDRAAEGVATDAFHLRVHLLLSLAAGFLDSLVGLALKADRLLGQVRVGLGAGAGLGLSGDPIRQATHALPDSCAHRAPLP